MKRNDIKYFLEEIIEKMLEYQEIQTGKRDIEVFKKDRCSNKSFGGFDWDDTKEGSIFWNDIIHHENFMVFFILNKLKDLWYDTCNSKKIK